MNHVHTPGAILTDSRDPDTVYTQCQNVTCAEQLYAFWIDSDTDRLGRWSGWRETSRDI